MSLLSLYSLRINDILDLLWPYAKAAVKAEFDKLAGPYLAKLKGYVVVAELDLGPDAPFVGGMKTYDTKNEDTVMLDLDICVSIEPSIRIEGRWRSFVFPVKVLSVSATMTARVTLTELVGKFPCFRRLGISLARKPQIQTVVDILGFNFFDVPILGSYAQHLVEDVVMNLFGWPKELSIPVMVETADEAAARNKKEPKGLVHVFLMSASNLRNADVGILGKSDPYCKLAVGQQKQTSPVIHDNLNPTWNADFEFIVYEPETEILSLELFDSDHVKGHITHSTTSPHTPPHSHNTHSTSHGLNPSSSSAIPLFLCVFSAQPVEQQEAG
jgi:Ca2+-dependent lipid-binding protein